MRSACSLPLMILAVSAAFGGCGKEKAEQRREVAAFERAMGTVSLTSKDERGAALSHLESLELASDEVKAVRDLCVSAFVAVGHSETVLAEARQRTERAEAAMEGAGAGDPNKANEAAALGQQAASSLAGLETAIAAAQARVDECERRRATLRTRFLSP